MRKAVSVLVVASLLLLSSPVFASPSDSGEGWWRDLRGRIVRALHRLVPITPLDDPTPPKP